MPFLVTIHATFENQSDADHVYNQTKAVAMNASVARIGESGERTSYGAVYNEDDVGVLSPIHQFHIDRFGIVRDGKLLPDEVTPEWIQPTGAQDAYPLTDVWGNPTKVIYNGSVRINQSDVNTQIPDVAGWNNPNITEDVSPPAWQVWSGLNEDLYQIGDKVSHNGSNWESTNADNHWEPGVFGWVQL